MDDSGSEFEFRCRWCSLPHRQPLSLVASALSLSLSLSLSWFGVDHGNGLQVNLKCKQFYTLGLPILRLKILIFGLTKFSVQTHL